MKSGSSSSDTAGTISMEFQSILKEIKFPARRNEIVSQARNKGISDETLAEIGMIPDKQYSSADDVMKEYEKKVSSQAR